MTWRAHIDSRDMLYRGVNVFLVDDRGDNGYTILGPGGHLATTVTARETEAAPAEPTLFLPNGADHALLAALSKHLGAVEHPAALRKDYDAERARVDRLLEHLISPMRTLP